MQDIDLVRLLIKVYDVKLLKENIDEVKMITNSISKENIKKLLFFNGSKGIKEIDFRTLNFLRDVNYDMQDICFDYVKVSGNNFSGLKNVVINIDNIVDKDISNTILDGVTLVGSLDNALVRGTNFEGFKGKLILNPQKVRNKDLSITNLSGVIIDGVFDECDIFSANFNGALGGIYINPQKIKDKNLENVNLCGVHLIGDNGKKACFKGCKIKRTSFKGANGVIEINPQELGSNYIMYCNFYGVKFTGGFDNITLLGNEFKGSINALIDLNRVSDVGIISKRALEDVDYIPLEKKVDSNSKRKTLSLFKRNKI